MGKNRIVLRLIVPGEGDLIEQTITLEDSKVDFEKHQTVDVDNKIYVVDEIQHIVRLYSSVPEVTTIVYLTR